MNAAEDFMSPAHLLQPIDLRSSWDEERDRVVVASILVDRTWQVLSRYGDDIWHLPVSTTNLSANGGRLHFKKIPHQFRRVMKAILWRYLRKGREGGIRPAATSVRKLFDNGLAFLRYLDRIQVTELATVSTLTCSAYVKHSRGIKTGTGKPLTPGTLTNRFTAVEAIYELSQFTFDQMSQKPWEESSAAILSGEIGAGHPRRLDAKTPLIPDDAFCAMFQAAATLIEKGPQLLALRDTMTNIQNDNRERASSTVWKLKADHLENHGWSDGIAILNRHLYDLRTACYIVVASLSGCRNHELAFVNSESYYSTEGADGEPYWWMKSKSTKTDAGHVEWMIPELAVEALRVMDWWAKPYQASIEEELAHRRSKNPADPLIAKAQMHRHAVFLGGGNYGKLVRTLTTEAWNLNLKAFAKEYGVRWSFATHQFRRKFASYAARSRFGDLRYLKKHFKHWTIDMTLIYAVNESQELALFAEIIDELDTLREDKISEWLDPATPLSGGTGHAFMTYRNNSPITLFPNHSTMVKTISENVSIRSNGHAWCTADSGIDCVGNGGLERIRCTDCRESVIGACHARVYQGLFDHLTQLLDCTDIGDAGLERVRRDIDRCANVLRELGYDPILKKAA